MTLRMLSGGWVPLETTYGTFEVALFENGSGDRCLAVLSRPFAMIPAVRLHSGCFLGDVLGSTECDCNEQLHQALERIAAESGVVLYLFQEGRGAGLAHMLRAMGMQKTEGLDGHEAYGILGIPYDSRSYDVAVLVLQEIHVPTRIRLMTMNERKISAIVNAGFIVDAGR